MSGDDNVTPAPAKVEDLRVVCSWCGKVLHEGAPGAPVEATSHGICATCREQWKKDVSNGIATLDEAGRVEYLA